jgi:hypothetical protein
MSKARTIRFNNSFATWLANDQKSYGRFTIESVCSFSHNNTHLNKKEYFLLSKVIAGNVYAKSKLIKDPVYEFSSIFSEKEYKIIRNYCTQDKIKDNSGVIEDLFEKVDFSIDYTQGEILEDFDSIAEATLSNRNINARIEFNIKELDSIITIEFPVKHINVQTDLKEYQVETGPLLLPGKTIQTKNYINNLNVAYLTFNEVSDTYFAVSSMMEINNKDYIRFFSSINKLKTNKYLISY